MYAPLLCLGRGLRGASSRRYALSGDCVCESLYKCWPRTGLLCNLCGPGLRFSVRTRSWCRFRCVHAPLAHRRPRRGAAPIVQIHWLQWPWESLYKGLPRSAFLNIRPAESLVPRRARRRPRDPPAGGNFLVVTAGQTPRHLCCARWHLPVRRRRESFCRWSWIASPSEMSWRL